MHQLPLIIEKDEDGFFVIECPLFSGCYTQAKTKKEALENIKEVIDICLEEKANKEMLQSYYPKNISFQKLAYA